MNRSEIVEAIRRAGKEQRVIRIQAYEADGSIESREVEPYSFRPPGTTDRFFFHCLLRDGTRNFLVDNIIDAHVTDRHFEPRWPIEL